MHHAFGIGAAHFFLGLLEKERGRAGPALQEARRAEAGAQGDFLRTLAAAFAAGAKGAQ